MPEVDEPKEKSHDETIRFILICDRSLMTDYLQMLATEENKKKMPYNGITIESRYAWEKSKKRDHRKMRLKCSATQIKKRIQ